MAFIQIRGVRNATKSKIRGQSMRKQYWFAIGRCKSLAIGVIALFASSAALAERPLRDATGVMALIQKIDRNAEVTRIAGGENPAYRVTNSTLVHGELQFYACGENGESCKFLVYVDRRFEIYKFISSEYMDLWNQIWPYAVGVILEDGSVELRIPLEGFSDQGYTQAGILADLSDILKVSANFPYLPMWFIHKHQIDIEAIMAPE